jgi:hypothetical protein
VPVSLVPFVRLVPLVRLVAACVVAACVVAAVFGVGGRDREAEVAVECVVGRAVLTGRRFRHLENFAAGARDTRHSTGGVDARAGESLDRTPPQQVLVLCRAE